MTKRIYLRRVAFRSAKVAFQRPWNRAVSTFVEMKPMDSAVHCLTQATSQERPSVYLSPDALVTTAKRSTPWGDRRGIVNANARLVQSETGNVPQFSPTLDILNYQPN
jgi:hypothetical protein